MKNLVVLAAVCLVGVASAGERRVVAVHCGTVCRKVLPTRRCRPVRRVRRPVCRVPRQICCPASTVTTPADNAAASKPKNEWVLFDGKSLDDWKRTNFGGEGEISIRDGAIFMDYGADLTGVHREWPLRRINYEVELEAQRVEGQDFFVGLTFPVKESHCSLILGGWGGGVCGLSSIDGYDASENETTSYENFTVGKWYKVRLRVMDGEIAAWVDGKELVRVDTTGRRLSVRFEVEPSQPFGLCAFQTQSAVRNVRAKLVEPKPAG